METKSKPQLVLSAFFLLFLQLKGMAAFSLFSLEQESAVDLSVDDRIDPLMADSSIGNSTEPATTPESYLPNQIVLGVVGFLALFTVTAMIYKERRERGRQQVINSYQAIGQSVEEKREEQKWSRERGDTPYQGYADTSSSLVGQIYATPGTSQGRSETPKRYLKNEQVLPGETEPKALDVIAEVHVEKRPDTPAYDEVLVHVEDEVKTTEEKIPEVKDVPHEEDQNDEVLVHVQDDAEMHYAGADEHTTSLDELENQDLKGIVGGNLVLQNSPDSSGETLIQLARQGEDSPEKPEIKLSETSSSDV